MTPMGMVGYVSHYSGWGRTMTALHFSLLVSIPDRLRPNVGQMCLQQYDAYKLGTQRVVPSRSAPSRSAQGAMHPVPSECSMSCNIPTAVTLLLSRSCTKDAHACLCCATEGASRLSQKLQALAAWLEPKCTGLDPDLVGIQTSLSSSQPCPGCLERCCCQVSILRTGWRISCSALRCACDAGGLQPMARGTLVASSCVSRRKRGSERLAPAPQRPSQRPGQRG